MNELKKKSRLSTANAKGDKKLFTVKSLTHKADKIKAVIQRPGEISKIIEISNTLKAFQQAVGGRIEVINFCNSLVGIIDKEGRFKNKIANIDYCGSDIRGTVLVIAEDGENFRGLTIQEIQTARAYLAKNSIGGYDYGNKA